MAGAIVTNEAPLTEDAARDNLVTGIWRLASRGNDHPSLSYIRGLIEPFESAIRASRPPSDEKPLCVECEASNDAVCLGCGLPWHGDRPLGCPRFHAGHDFVPASRPPLTDSVSVSVAEARVAVRAEMTFNGEWNEAALDALIAAVRAESRHDA